MRTYAVAGSGSVQQLLDHQIGGILVSFASDKQGRTLAQIPRSMPVLLDSGAFTAWTTGKQVDIDELAAWAKRHTGSFDTVDLFNLDVITGPGITVKERDAAIAQGAENAQTLRAAGLQVVEVFHLSEPLSVLDEILARRRPGERIAFGGLAKQRGGLGFPIRYRFCSAAFRHLADRFGWDRLPPVHGLGVSPDGPIGGGRFPWASVDCSSWMSISQYGVRVTAAGKRLGGRSDSRTNNKVLASAYMSRVLAGWVRLDRQYAALWASRGVEFQL